MDNESGGEESLDSIPRPEYEAIENGSTKSTPTPETLQANTTVEGVATAAAAAVELSQYSDNEEDDDAADEISVDEAEEEEDYDDEDMEAAQQINTLDEENTLEEIQLDKKSNTKSYAYDNVVASEKKDTFIPMAAAVPVQILTTVTTSPTTMLPAKTKDNKLVMVQLVDESGKTVKPVATTTTLAITIPTPETQTKFSASNAKTTPTDEKSMPQQRSSTPMSREFLALQRSVNESKILSEFVTDTGVVKARKLRKSAAANNKDSSVERANTPSGNKSISEESSTKTLERRKSSGRSVTPLHITADTVDGTTPLSNSAEKQRKSSKFAPLKDHESINFTVSFDSTLPNMVRRSRSKSVHRKSPIAQLDTTSNSKLKRWPSDEKILKRTNMRSQNSDFVQKQMDFLNRVIHQQRDEQEVSDIEDELDNKSQLNFDIACAGEDVKPSIPDVTLNESTTSLSGNCSLPQSSTQSLSLVADVSMLSLPEVAGTGTAADTDTTDSLEARLKVFWQAAPKRGWDSFCWKCRECADLIPCSKCVRCFHTTCIKITAATKLDNTWICPECTSIENVLNGPKRTRRNDLSLDLLSQLLSFALKRMKNVKGHAKHFPVVDSSQNYTKYIVHPVTFNTLQEKIEKKSFRCAEEFVNETKWMVHNALILNCGTSKETLAAKAILKTSRQEANEIDTCPECYLNANTRADWFVDVCTQPHLLLWAKLKGFPYWPAKSMGPGQGPHVNVRFFGEHDRAFVPIKDCFLYSEQDPNTQTGKRSARELADCIKEVEVHIQKIKAKVGNFKYALYRTPYDPAEELQQLECMMPGVSEYMKRQQALVPKQSLQFKIVKTADNHMSIIKKASANESGNDSDHSSNTTKRKLLEASSSTNELVVATKYEVVSKTNSDESNSSKVSTVILKRKSDVNTSSVGEPKKSNDEVELPLPKMTKIDDSEEEQRMLVEAASVIAAATLAATTASSKRKHDAESSATSPKTEENVKQKAKHSKQDTPEKPRIPVLTIKTNGAKVEKLKDATSTTEPINEVATQRVVDHLVKHKQGVTIKKITKENSSSKKSALATVESGKNIVAAVVNSENLNSPELLKNKQNVATEKAKHAEKVTNILKDLVPFVEIKKEVHTDEETETEEPAATKGTNAGDQNAPVTTPTVSVAVSPVQVPVAAPVAELIPLATVKQEILSEAEEDDETISKTINKQTTSDVNHVQLTAAPIEKLLAVPALLPSSDTVRVVGGTTIQRLSTKCNITSNSSAQIMLIPNTTSNIGSVNASSGKRIGTRGVPYGPLPASATPTANSSANNTKINTGSHAHNSASNNALNTTPSSNIHFSSLQQQQQQQQHQQHLQQLRQSQRARKSFPNRSPPAVSPARSCTNTNTNTTGSIITAPGSAPSAAELKRSMLKNSMVSIPVDVATANRNIGCINSTNSIPVPPLTAVSKTIPTAANAITTVANSVTAATVATSAAANFASICTNGMSVFSSSAPPPLAGLSPITSTSAPVAASNSSNATANVVTGNDLPECVVTLTPAVVSAPAPTTLDAHILGDFVTPTLASAITEVICRGPPKMSLRPNGPLQSEGSAMFPSQAGPVCRTLVENAHKLTDFFISVMEDTMCEMSVGEEPVLQAKITLLTMELERTKQAYEHEIAELKRTSDLMLCEMRKSMENEKTRIAGEIRKQCELERLRSIEDTKKKQWCANCGREAQFYCCWNTSYCDYPCQQLHWSRHAASCAQTRPQNNDTAPITTATTASVTVSGAATNAAGSATGQVANNQINQQERQHVAKSTMHTNNAASNATQAATTHYNKTVISSKKEKNSAKSSATITAISTPPPPSAEVLKLPTNTYLRAVPASANTVRNSPYAMPVQRYNIPLPITAPVNTGPPYTIVQRGSSWELMSTSTASSNSTTQAVNATTAQQQQQQHQQHQTRIVTNSMPAPVKNSSRNRAANAATVTLPISSQQHATALQCGVRMPTQM